MTHVENVTRLADNRLVTGSTFCQQSDVLSSAKMPRTRSSRALLQKQQMDDEFETPAFQNLKEHTEINRRKVFNSDDEDEINFESEPDASDCEQEMSEKHVFGNSSEEDNDDDDDVRFEPNVKDTPECVLDDDDDSDAAPDAVGFSETRSEALSQMKLVMEQLKEEKQKLKSKRKQKDELYKEQKRSKIAAGKRLPDRVLDTLPEEFDTVKPKKHEPKSHRKDRKRQQIAQNTEDAKKCVIEESVDYLPLTVGFVDSESGIKAVSLKDMRKEMAVSNTAANFRHSRLYGDPRKRESSQVYFARQKKKKALKYS